MGSNAKKWSRKRMNKKHHGRTLKKTRRLRRNKKH